MRTTKSHLRYFDYLGNVLDAWGKTGGQQGDPLEMIIFCLSVHHLWGRTLAKHHQDACAVAYADDGYIKAKLSVALEVLSDLKHVLKEDAPHTPEHGKQERQISHGFDMRRRIHVIRNGYIVLCVNRLLPAPLPSL